MMDYILRAPEEKVQKHYFGIFDGIKWHVSNCLFFNWTPSRQILILSVSFLCSTYTLVFSKCYCRQKFLRQFRVKPQDNPQYIILDLPGKTYWRNETYTKLADFLKATEDGSIPPRNPEKTNFKEDPGAWITDKFVQYMPFSVVPIAVLLGVIIYAVTPPSDQVDYEQLEDKSNESKKDK